MLPAVLITAVLAAGDPDVIPFERLRPQQAARLESERVPARKGAWKSRVFVAVTQFQRSVYR